MWRFRRNPAPTPRSPLPISSCTCPRLDGHRTPLNTELSRPARPYRYNHPLANRSEHGHIATENATGFSSSDFENSMDNHSVVTSHKPQDILYDLPPPKRSRPRPLSRSLVVAWKHVSANLRLQESYVEEMEYVTSNFIIVDSTSFSMSTHSLPLHPDCNNPISRSTPRPHSYNRSESFLELAD